MSSSEDYELPANLKSNFNSLKNGESLTVALDIQTDEILHSEKLKNKSSYRQENSLSNQENSTFKNQNFTKNSKQHSYHNTCIPFVYENTLIVGSVSEQEQEKLRHSKIVKKFDFEKYFGSSVVAKNLKFRLENCLFLPDCETEFFQISETVKFLLGLDKNQRSQAEILLQVRGKQLEFLKKEHRLHLFYQFYLLYLEDKQHAN